MNIHPTSIKKSLSDIPLSIIHFLTLFLLLQVLTFLSTPAVLCANKSINIDELKSVYIYNFAAFVYWPDSSYKQNQANLKICTIGNSKIAHNLRAITKDEIIHGKKIIINEVDNKLDAQSCHILFIDSSVEDQHINLLKYLKTKDILLVGESLDFLARGGMINLKHNYKRIQIEINLDNIKKNHLSVSSKLIRLATIKS